uniref:KOW domain-containing RNA-binding protein n=1 Tax=Ndongobacter massiliensis TaxID=1871025 RepID=UPI00093045D6|nr:KOW domain-containing RNA-binding protein [Ndongobacter massiliensis]
MTQERNPEGSCDLRPGQVVRSKAGHDRTGLFLVWDVLDAKHVRIVDGKRRTIAKPKKKRVIHLQPYNAVVENFEALKTGCDFHDAKIRSLLEPYEQ